MVQFPRLKCRSVESDGNSPFYLSISKVIQTELKKKTKSVNGCFKACVLSEAEVKIATDIFLASYLSPNYHTLPLYVSCNLSPKKDGKKKVLNKMTSVSFC